MITNDRQYKLAQTNIKEFEVSLEQANEHWANEDPIIRQSLIDSMHGQVEELKAQIEEYDAIKSGEVKTFTVSFDDLDQALIRARVASGLSQRELAEKIGIAEQQIQRYERRWFQTASLSRLKELVWALGIQLNVTVSLPQDEGSPVPAEQFFKSLKSSSYQGRANNIQTSAVYSSNFTPGNLI